MYVLAQTTVFSRHGDSVRVRRSRQEYRADRAPDHCAGWRWVSVMLLIAVSVAVILVNCSFLAEPPAVAPETVVEDFAGNDFNPTLFRAMI